MDVKAILFASLGVLTETSELRRLATNEAIAEADPGWTLSREEFAKVLQAGADGDHLALTVTERDPSVDGAAISRRASQIFHERLARDGLPLRHGIEDILGALRIEAVNLALVTASDPEAADAILEAARVDRDQFDYLGLRQTGAADADVYRRALDKLELAPGEAIAVAERPDSAAAAVAAGIPTIAFPGEYHLDKEFPGVFAITGKITPELLGLRQPV